MQITAFLTHSNSRVASLATAEERKAAAGGQGVQQAQQQQQPGGGAADEEQQAAKAQRAYANLKTFHAKKGWGAHARAEGD